MSSVKDVQMPVGREGKVARQEKDRRWMTSRLGGENVKFQRDRSQMGSKQLRDEWSEQETAGSLAGMFFNQQIEIPRCKKSSVQGQREVYWDGSHKSA